MTTTAVERDRRTYIGGSETAAVLGLSRWRTPLAVWAEKTGQVAREDQDSLAKMLGRRLEEVVSELFTLKTGKALTMSGETLFHPTHDFLGANIDRRVVGEDAIFEAKTAASWKQKEWKEDEIPQEYILQCLHYLGVTGAARCYLAVLIGNQDFQIRTIERDENAIRQILAKEVEFWNTYVVPNVMPFNITKRDDDTLYKLFPMADEGKVVALGDDANRIIESIEALEADAKNVEGLIEKHKNELKALLKDAETGLSAMYKVTWKNTSSCRIDSKKLRADFPEVAGHVTKETKSRVLKYKVREDTNGSND